MPPSNVPKQIQREVVIKESPIETFVPSGLLLTLTNAIVVRGKNENDMSEASTVIQVQISAGGTDAVGNLTNDCGRTRTYDGNNKMISAFDAGVPTSYRYNADGQRVIKTVGTVSTWYIYGMGGELIAEYPANGATNMPQMEYGYRGGELLIEGGCDVVRWKVSDHLGSTRMSVGTTGTLASVKRTDYLPFGEEIGATVGIRTALQGYSQVDCWKQKFTGYEKDTETGLDYAQARYYANVQGRFTGVDPLLSSAKIAQPQSWNRYAYASNNPLLFTDPFGMYSWSTALGGNVSDDVLLANAGDNRGDRRRAEGIIRQRDQIRNAITAARDAAARSDDPQKVLNALNAYGTERVDNGVTIAIGATKDGVAGEATRNGDDLTVNADGTVRANVLVTFNSNISGNELAVTVAHEGQHTLDRQAYARVVEDGLARGISQESISRSPYNPTVRVTETRAYTVSSLMAQGLRMDNYIMAGTQAKIWDSGWDQADRATKRSNGINQHLTNSPTYNKRLKERVFPQ